MALRHLIVREVKAALKNPAFIASLVLLFIFYMVIGGAARSGISQAIEETMRMRVAIVTEESTELVTALLQNLNTSTGGGIRVYQSVESALNENIHVIILPKGFTESALIPEKTPVLKALVKIDTLSQVTIQSRVGVVQSLASLTSSLLPRTIALLYNISIPPQKSVVVNTTVIAFGRTMSITEVNSLLNFAIATMFIVSFIMGITTSSAAANTAIEKVEKAFEMLLAQPIPRREIVLAKIIGAMAIALLSGVVYFIALFAMLFLMASPTAGVATEGSMPEISTIMTYVGGEALGYVIIPLVVGLIYSGAIGVIIGSISSDERIAGVLAAPITFLYVGLAIASMFMNLPVNTLTAMLYGVLVAPLPYIYTVSKMSNSLTPLVIGTVTAMVSCIIIITIAVVVFNRDTVILGVRWPKKGRET
uniref:ABC transporter permease n=1 Tax=Ignisphaera aggregans TaxID=334771 RepID=A0A7J3Z4T9_9CREN